MADRLVESTRQLFESRFADTAPSELFGLSVTQVVTRFRVSLDRFRQTVLAADSETQAKSRRVRPKSLVQAGRDLSADERNSIERTIDNLIEKMNDLMAGVIDQWVPNDSNEDDPTAFILTPELLSPVMFLLAGPSEFAKLREEFARSVNVAGLQYMQEYQAWRQAPSNSNLLATALLPAVISEFEGLVAGLMRLALTLTPNAMGLKKRHATVEEMRAYGSVEAVELALVSKVIDDLMREDVYSWKAKIAKWPGIDVEALTPDWDVIVEAFLRRNLVVHQGGRVDNEYLNKLPSSCERPHLGQYVNPNVEYVVHTIDRLTAVGMGLAGIWQRKLRSSWEYSAHLVYEVVVLMLERERWAEAEKVASFALPYMEQRDDIDILKVNRWMARREQANTIEAIKIEVGGWAPVDDSLEWRVARLALLNDHVAVARELESARSSGADLRYMATWPLLVQLGRIRPQLRALLTSQGTRIKPVPRKRRRR